MTKDALSPAQWTVETNVEDENWRRRFPAIEALVEEVARRVGTHPDIAPHLAEGPDVAVLLTDDARVRALNAAYRGKDAPTNVLSFINDDAFTPPGEAPHLGDLALAYGVVAREADEQKKPFENHLAHLLVHGLLHVMGYDHMNEDEARRMEGLEIDILASMGLPDPYGDIAPEEAG